MTRTILSYPSLLFLGVALANADPIVSLDFNDLQVDEEVLGYYSGGLGSLGTGPGPDLGISFTSDFVTVPFGVFGPPDLSEQLTSDSGTMNVAAGFSGGFSFYYANSGSLLLYSGLDGTGSLVGSLLLPDNGGFGATGLEQLIPFESAVFSGNGLMLDNITFAPGGELVLPEPSSINLLCIGLVAIFFALRRAAGLDRDGCKARALLK
jgi:hypothetical protein